MTQTQYARDADAFADLVEHMDMMLAMRENADTCTTYSGRTQEIGALVADSRSLMRRVRAHLRSTSPAGEVGEMVEQAVQAALDAGVAENGKHGVAAARVAARFVLERLAASDTERNADYNLGFGIEAQQAEIARLRASEWQPIETAPKGQGLIDIWTTHSGGTRYASCYYDNICGEWRSSQPAGRLHCIPERFVTHWQPLPEPPATDDVAAPRSCCADERERQENTIRALEEAAIDLWEQSPEIAKINPWVRCEWSEVSERSRIYWRGLALTTAIRSNSHD